MNNEKGIVSVTRPIMLGALVLAGVTAWSSCGAVDLPKRKLGLWEIQTMRDGKATSPAAEICIDSSTDDLIRQANKDPNCQTKDVNVTGNTIKTHAVCQMGGTTITTDAVYSGDFQSSYKGEINSKYTPAMFGRSSSHVTQSAKWVGPCKAGQKGGDVAAKGMGNMNINGLLGQGKH